MKLEFSTKLEVVVPYPLIAVDVPVVVTIPAVLSESVCDVALPLSNSS